MAWQSDHHGRTAPTQYIWHDVQGFQAHPTFQIWCSLRVSEHCLLTIFGAVFDSQSHYNVSDYSLVTVQIIVLPLLLTATLKPIRLSKHFPSALVLSVLGQRGTYTRRIHRKTKTQGNRHRPRKQQRKRQMTDKIDQQTNRLTDLSTNSVLCASQACNILVNSSSSLSITVRMHPLTR